MTDSNQQVLPSSPDNKTDVVRCGRCDAPVVKSTASCAVCSAPLTGHEMTYVAYKADTVSAKPLIVQLLLLWGGVLLITGFSPNHWVMLVLILVSAFYGVKIFKRLI